MSIFTVKTKFSFVVLAGVLTLWTCGSNTTSPNIAPGITTVTDIDGNVYPAETIGTQVWTIYNLRTTRFNDGTPIPLIGDSIAWSSLKTQGSCWWYDDSVLYSSMVGRLYNWYAVNTGKLAPAGWHVPADSDWTVLTSYMSHQGKTGTPKNGYVPVYFPPRCTGYRDTSGTFHFVGLGGYWWSATAHDTAQSWTREWPSDTVEIKRGYCSKNFGLGVLCVKGN